MLLNYFGWLQPKKQEPLVLGTAERISLINRAFSGIPPRNKESLVYHVISLLSPEQKRDLARTLDRDLWREMKP